MANKMLTMAGLGAMALGAVLLIVIFAIIPLIGEEVDGAVSIPTDTAATGTFTSTTNLTLSEYNVTATRATINISTETYTFANTTGSFLLDMSGGANNSSGIIAAIVAEITANSTLVAAVDNGDNTTTVTAVDETAAGNTYDTTDNATGQAWGAALMSGGITGSQWDSNTNTDLPTAVGFWESVSPFITLSAIMLFIGGFIGTLKGLRR